MVLHYMMIHLGIQKFGYSGTPLFPLSICTQLGKNNGDKFREYTSEILRVFWPDGGTF